jgi:hypothetical protein
LRDDDDAAGLRRFCRTKNTHYQDSKTQVEETALEPPSRQKFSHVDLPALSVNIGGRDPERFLTIVPE